VNEWVISELLGIQVTEWWGRVDPDIEGQYEPRNLATGIATVAAGEH